MALFDKFARNYDEGHIKAVRLSGFEPSYFHEYKPREVADYLTSKGMAGKKIKFLNFGCGTGNSEKYIKKYIPNSSVYAIDVSEESIKVAKEENKGLSDVIFEPFDGTNIPFDTDFDVIFVANVFHHLRREKHINILQNLYRKLATGGFFFIFELNPLNLLTMWVAIKNDYKFDSDAKLLSPFYSRRILTKVGFAQKEIKYTIFFPRFLSYLTPLERYLCKIPLGAHYYYVAKKKGDDPP